MGKQEIYLRATYSQVIDVSHEQAGTFELWYTSPFAEVYVDRSALPTVAGIYRDRIRHAALIAMQDRNLPASTLRDARKRKSSPRVSKRMKEAQQKTEPMFSNRPKLDDIPF